MNEAVNNLLKERYFLQNENTWEQLAVRVGGIYEPATDLIKEMKFIPSTPTLMNGNTNGQRLGGLSSCFVMGIEDSIEGIFDALKESAIVTKNAGGIGYDFSPLRSSNEEIKTLDGRKSSGPLPFMDMFNSMLDGIRQGGARKGAGGAWLNIDHPSILEFIEAKKDYSTQRLNRFNLSVRVPGWFYDKLDKTPNEIMQVKNVTDSKTFDLIDNDGNTVTVKQLWDRIIKLAHQSAEPGILNSDISERQCTVLKYGNMKIGNNPCCAVGDTIINTDKGPMTIRDLSKSSDDFKRSIRVQSYNPDRNELTYEHIDAAWLAKADANDIVEIETEDGLSIKVTSDHNILTTRGYIEAKDLTDSDEIVSYY